MCLCSRLDIKYWSTRNEQIWYVLKCWYVKEVEHDETLIMIVCSWTFHWVGYKQDDWVCNPPFFCWPCNVRWTAQINRLKIKQTAELFVWCDVMTSSPSPLLVWLEDIISQDAFDNVWFDRYEWFVSAGMSLLTILTDYVFRLGDGYELGSLVGRLIFGFQSQM